MPGAVLVREQHPITVSRVERRKSALVVALKQRPTYTNGDLAWTYTIANIIRWGAKSGTDAKVPKAKLKLNHKSPFKLLAVGPASSGLSLDGRPLAAQLFHLGLRNDMPGADAHCRVSVARCKRCTNPHDTIDLPRYLLVRLMPPDPPPFTSQPTTFPCLLSVWRSTRSPATSPYEVSAEISPLTTKHTGKVSCAAGSGTWVELPSILLIRPKLLGQ